MSSARLSGDSHIEPPMGSSCATAKPAFVSAQRTVRTPSLQIHNHAAFTFRAFAAFVFAETATFFFSPVAFSIGLR